MKHNDIRVVMVIIMDNDNFIKAKLRQITDIFVSFKALDFYSIDPNNQWLIGMKNSLN